jgi:hypothetical protein
MTIVEACKFVLPLVLLVLGAFIALLVPQTALALGFVTVLIEPGGLDGDPPWSWSALPCVRGAHFHHTCAPLFNQMATLGVPRCASALP